MKHFHLEKVSLKIYHLHCIPLCFNHCYKVKRLFRNYKIRKFQEGFFFAYMLIKLSYFNLEKDPNNELIGAKRANSSVTNWQQKTLNLLVEEHISLCILDAGLRHFSHTLVIKFIPQIVYVVPAVRYVVATWDQREQRASDRCKGDFFFSPSERAHECRTLALAKAKADWPTHCWQCRGGRWLTAGRSWWSGRSRLWPGRTAGPGPPVERTRGCQFW